MREKSTGGHKAIKVLSGISILTAVLSFVFLVIYIVSIISSIDGQKVEEKFGLAFASFVLFILLLILFAVFDLIIGVVALLNKENFSSDSAWLTVLCLVGVSFFFSGYIGACALIGVIIVVNQDARNVMNENRAGNTQGVNKTSNVVSATVIQGPPPSGPYASAAHTAYGAPQGQYQPPQVSQPYGAQPPQGSSNPYVYQF